MRHFGFLSLIIFTISCNGNQKSMQSSRCSDTLMINNKLFCLDSVSESYYNSINYKFPLKSDTLPIDTAKIKISSNGIIIKSQEKDVFLENDTTEGDSRVDYSYVKTLSNIGFVHIKAACWEWTNDYLINLKNGEQTRLWEQPILSPNKQMIVSNSADLVATEMPNGFQLFKIENGILKKIFETEIVNWGPSEIKWESDSTILIKRVKVDDKYTERFDFIRMNLK